VLEDPEALRTFRLLLPHLRQAVLTRSKLGELNVQRDSALAGLERLRHAVVVVAPDGKLLFLNRVATEMTGEPDGLTIGAAGLRAARPSEDAALQRLIREASIGTDDQPRSGGRLAISRPSARRPFAVLVMPLRLAPDGLARSTGAMALIVDPEREPQVSPVHLQQLYGLTPAEATVAIRILRGRGLQSVAEELSVTLSTVRIHLQRVFEKTQTHRQAELVRLLLDIQADG
jgi:DNA-binding CsgD family transcriptional regulator